MPKVVNYGEIKCDFLSDFQTLCHLVPAISMPVNLYALCMHDDLLDAIFMPLFHADKQIGFHVSNAFSILDLLINLNVSTF